MTFRIRTSLCAMAFAVVAIHTPAQGADGPALVYGPQTKVTTEDVLAESGRAAQEVRAKLLVEPDAIANTATNIYVRRILAERARAEGVGETPELRLIRQLLEERLLSDAYMNKVANAEVPDDATLEKLARTEFNAFPEKFIRPEQVHVHHILIAPPGDPEARKKAEEILAALKSGANFEETALSQSADKASAAMGGDLGYITKGKTVAEFQEAAFALTEKGQLSEVVATPYGYHIIRLDEHLKEGPQAFEQVRDMIKAKLANDFRRRAIDNLTKQVTADAKPNEAAIQAFSEANRGRGR